MAAYLLTRGGRGVKVAAYLLTRGGGGGENLPKSAYVIIERSLITNIIVDSAIQRVAKIN